MVIYLLLFPFFSTEGQSGVHWALCLCSSVLLSGTVRCISGMFCQDKLNAMLIGHFQYNYHCLHPQCLQLVVVSTTDGKQAQSLTKKLV